MVYATGCEPDIDWSPCEESTGFPAVLPAFFIVFAVLEAGMGVLYAVSMVHTLKLQLKTKKKLNYNSAMQMHVGIVVHSSAAFIHDVCLISRQPVLPGLALHILQHTKFICMEYSTTVLVRHWAVLYQQMGQNQQSPGQLNERTARFVELYREGETIHTVMTCMFLLGTVIYARLHPENWEQVARLESLVWAIFSGITCWLVTVLGQRVHANMKSVAKSQAVLHYVRRVKFVVIGSSFLWCQCTICFSMDAAFDRPVSARTWLFLHCGINLTGIGGGIIYFAVIGSKIADRAARAMEAARVPAEGVKQVQDKFQALANLVASGAHQFIGGVNNITSFGDASARVYIDGNDDKPRSYRGKASRRWSLRGAVSSRQSISMRVAGSGPGRGLVNGEGGYSEAKQEESHRLDEEVGIQGAPDFDGHAGNDEEGTGGGGEEKKTENRAVWESPVSPMRASKRDLTTKTEEDDANGDGELGSEDQQSSSWSRAHRRSSDGPARSSGEPGSEEDETWKVEELEVQSSRSGSHDSATSRQHSDPSFGEHHSDSDAAGSHNTSRSPRNHSNASGGISDTDTHDNWSENEDSHTLRSESSAYHE